MSWHFFNTLRPRQNVHHFPDDIFKCIFVNDNVWISIKISLKFVPMVRINTIPALVQIMAWRRPGDKPLSEPNVESFLTHICVTRPQWDNINVVQSVYATNLWLLIFFRTLITYNYSICHKTCSYVVLCFVASTVWYFNRYLRFVYNCSYFRLCSLHDKPYIIFSKNHTIWILSNAKTIRWRSSWLAVTAVNRAQHRDYLYQNLHAFGQSELKLVK